MNPTEIYKVQMDVIGKLMHILVHFLDVHHIFIFSYNPVKSIGKLVHWICLGGLGCMHWDSYFPLCQNFINFPLWNIIAFHIPEPLYRSTSLSQSHFNVYQAIYFTLKGALTLFSLTGQEPQGQALCPQE